MSEIRTSTLRIPGARLFYKVPAAPLDRVGLRPGLHDNPEATPGVAAVSGIVQHG